MSDKTLEVKEDRVKEAAKNYPQAEEVLKALFLEVFELDRNYPYYGVSKVDVGWVVYFTGPKTGTLLKGDTCRACPIGEKYDEWAEEEFTPIPREELFNI